MKRFKITLPLAAAIIALTVSSAAALAHDTMAEHSAGAISADTSAFTELNNDEGVESYSAAGALPTAAQLQNITPAAGGGLNEQQLNNWELHRLQRFYNGDDGVTK